MAKVRVDLRFDGDLLAWADAYAERRGASRTAVLEAAVAEFREACEGGVPELDAAAPAGEVGKISRPVRAVTPTVPPGSVREHAKGSYWAMMSERQERLNGGSR